MATTSADSASFGQTRTFDNLTIKSPSGKEYDAARQRSED
jgi:hypothetical protein